MFSIGRTLSFAAAAVIAAVSLTACTDGKKKSDDGRLSIVCTSFSEYDWTRNIIGSTDSADVTYLLKSGVDMHNYQPSTEDMLAVSDCDMLIYVGGSSEVWVDSALENKRNDDMKVLRLFEVLGQDIKEEELKDGMEEDEDEEDGGKEYDEHIWLSLKNAELLCGSICEALCKKDPSNADSYRSNLESYTQKLNALDSEYAEMAENASVKTVLFGDRFPFRYLVDDYGIDYYAAFPGCSAETAASFETVAVLAQKVDKLGLDSVFIIENSDDSIARSIISSSENHNASIEVLDSIQSVTAAEAESGTTYLSIMEKNLETLKKVLD